MYKERMMAPFGHFLTKVFGETLPLSGVSRVTNLDIYPSDVKTCESRYLPLSTMSIPTPSTPTTGLSMPTAATMTLALTTSSLVSSASTITAATSVSMVEDHIGDLDIMQDVRDKDGDDGDSEEERPWNVPDIDLPLADPGSLSLLFVWPTSDFEMECLELMAETQAEAVGLTAKD